MATPDDSAHPNPNPHSHAQSHPQQIHTPVLIIGGGIVGLTASLLLTQHATPSVLVERHATTSIHPRARRVNGRTMEIYRGLGIAGRVREAGAALRDSFGIYEGRTLREVVEGHERRGGGGGDGDDDVKKQNDGEGESESERERRGGGERAGANATTGNWSGKGKGKKTGAGELVKLFTFGPEDGAFATQDVLEPVLVETARERGMGELRFNTECLDIRQDSNGVTAKLRDRETGIESTVTADYLIAADGANSPIRTQLAVPTTGRGSISHLLNILFKADLRPLVSQREFSLCVVSNPQVTGLFTAINNTDTWVFHLYYDPSAPKNETPADFPPERCVELLRIALGIPDIDIEIKSILPWEPTVKVATRLQHGRVFLAGDAAHQMPPYAGLGANTGIGDVHNLAWKLAAVVRKQAGAELLSTYDAERLEVGRVAAEGSGKRADSRGLIVTKKDFSFFAAIARLLPMMLGFGYVYSGRGVVEESTWPLGGLSWRPWSIASLFMGLDGRPGSRAPHVWVERDGERISTMDLHGSGYVLLAGSRDGGKAWIEACQKVEKKIDGVELVAYSLGPGPQSQIMDRSRSWETAAGIGSDGALLVRPDGFVAWRARRMPSDAQGALEEVIRRVSCL